MKKKISTAILAAAICLYGCYIGGNNEFAKTYAIENEPIPIPTEIPLPTEQIAHAEPGCYMKIASEPDKVIYRIGDKLDLTGLKLDVMFASGGEMPISQVNNNWQTVIHSKNPLENDNFIVDTSDFDSSKPGEYNITISLTQEAQLKWWNCRSINIPVTVIDDPIPTEEMVVCVEPGCYMKIASEPDKVIYNIGDKLDLTGLKLDVMYASGGSKPVSQINNDWSMVINSENPLENDSFIVDTSDFDSSKPGKYNITISLTQEAQLKWWYCPSIDIPVTVTDNGALIKGDVNADGLFSVADVVMLQKWLVSARDINLPDWKAADLNEDGKLDVFDICAMKRRLIESTPPEPVESVEAFIPVAEFLFSELDNGTIKVKDSINRDEFKALAGEDSEIYKNSHSSYIYTEGLKPSEEFNIEYLLEIVSEDDPFYEYLKDTEKLDLLFMENTDEFISLFNNAIPDRGHLKAEDVFSPAGLENWKATFDSYRFVHAYILDNDTIVINNGTGLFFTIEGIIITRNGKVLENNYISVPEKWGYDGDHISVNKKINGYDNVYQWWGGL